MSSLLGDVLHIGFTGTRQLKHVTHKRVQRAEDYLRGLFSRGLPVVVHHGDCIGADAWVHRFTLDNSPHGTRIVIHPPTNSKYRAWCTGASIRANSGMSVEFREPRAYLVRDTDIVKASSVLVALPVQTTEVLRSGTWATIRRARKRGVGVLLA